MSVGSWFGSLNSSSMASASYVRAVVLADSDVLMLGQTYLRHIGAVKISNDTMMLE